MAEKTFTGEQYKADCAAIDEAVKGGWWINRDDGQIELEYDYRNESSLAEIAYANRDEGLDEYQDALYEHIDDKWFEEVNDAIDQICKDAGIDFSDWERLDAARTYIQETYGVFPPFEELMDEKLKVNIMLTTDSERDFDFGVLMDMRENLSEGYEVPFDVMDNALVKLAEMQGYLFDDLKAAYNCYQEDGFKDCLAKHGKFLATACDELANMTNIMNTVTVLAEVPVSELPLLCSPGYEFKIDKSTPVGIFAPWVGGGSLLELDLEKPITIPSEMVFDVQVEGVKCDQGYTVDEVYGLVPSAWGYSLKVEVAEVEQPREEKGSEGRKPGELKSAGKAPEQPGREKVTPAADGKVCSASAAARGADAPAKSSPEIKRS